jgi:protein O-mannosyl-transferase
MQKKDISLILALVLYVGLILTYSNHFNNEFHFDDYHTVTGNPWIKKLENIPRYFVDGTTFSALPSNQSYRPLTTVSLALDYWFSGGTMKPFYFHISTFIWFLLQGVMMFFFIRKIFKMVSDHAWLDYFSFFCTALFMFHPAVAETVNYVIARSDLMSTVAVLGSFLIFINYPQWRKDQLHLIPMVIGVLIKPPTLMYAPLLFVYILLFEKETGFASVFTSNGIKKFFNTFLIAGTAFIAFIALYVLQDKMTPDTWTPGGFNRPLYIATQTAVTAQYFFTYFWPSGLSADTDWSLFLTFNRWEVYAGSAFILSLLGIMVYTSERKIMRPIAFGIAWFFLALFPTAVTPLAEVLNDHRVFFPYVGLGISVVWTIALILIKYEKQIVESAIAKWGIPVLASLIIVGFAFWTRERNEVWKTEESLWYDVTIKSPGNGRGLMNYGVIKMGQGKYQEAEVYYEKAVELTPRYGTLQTNLGILKNALNKPIEAEMHFRKGVEYDPSNPASHYFYATYLNGKNRLAEAATYLETAVRLSPCYIVACQMLMDAYNKLGRADDLARVVKKTLECDPSDPIGNKYLNGPTLKVDPNAINQSNNADELINFSQQQYLDKKYEACIATCKKALAINPNLFEAWNNIGACYNEMKQWDNAIDALNKALAINPDFELAKNNLAWAKDNKNR